MAQPGLFVLSSNRASLKTPSLQTSEWAILITVALSTMLAPLNSTMIAVALPRIMADFDVTVSSAGWLVTGYLITMASLQPVTGKLGDRLGRRGLMLGGLFYFGLASLGAALAPSFGLLLLFRIQQGIAGAIALPNGAALLREIIPAERRAARFGLLGAAIALAAAGGPPLGGLLVDTFGWSAIFTVNIFFIVPALLLGWRTIPARSTPKATSPAQFDIVGAILLSAVLIGLAWLLTQSRRGDAQIGLIPGSIGLAAIFVFFIWRELKHPDPVLQPRFFTRRTFAAANGAIALSNLAMYSTLFTIPILLSKEPGWTDLKVGLILTAMSVAMVIFSPLGGRLADRFGRRWPTVGGLTLLTLGLLLLRLTWDITAAGTPHAPPLFALLTGLGIIGAGVGLSSAGLQTSAVEAVEPHEAGVASGVFSTSRYLGSIIGATILAALFGSGGELSYAVSTIFVMVIAAAFFSVLASLGLRDRPLATI